MLYKNFIIKDFKGIQEVNIDLDSDRIITLVGLNESGKTSVMEAINLFYEMIKEEEPQEDSLNFFRPKGTDFTGDIYVESNLVFEDEDIAKINTYWKEEMGKRTTLEISKDFSYTFKFNFKLHKFQKVNRSCGFDVKTSSATRSLSKTDSGGWQKLIDFIKSNLIPEILYYDDFIFEIPESIFFVKSGNPESDDISKGNNKIWQSVLNDILKASNSDFNFQEHIVDIWEDDNDSALNRISLMEKILNEKITSRWGALFGEQKINFKEIKINHKYANNTLELSFKIKTNAGKIFSVNERSKGFKWFFSFLLFTEFRKNRTKNILFLLDEPASNLHSSAQSKIIEAIEDLGEESLVIYSTHSHHLINPEWLSGSYICINESLTEEEFSGNLNEDDNAKIDVVKYFRYVGQGLGSDKISYFQPILDRLDYKPSFLEPIPKITILEGKNDFYALNYFAKIILKDEFKYNFYPGGGCNKLWEIIRLYLSWGSEFILILDGDKGGIKSQKEYLEEFGEYVEDKVFTFKDVLNISESIEGLVLKSDKKTIIDKVFGSGSYDKIKHKENNLKKTLATAFMKLLMDGISVPITKTTTGNFKKLLKFIKEKQGT